MRLWHKDLIPYLPKQQLLGQWRELCCIGALLAKDHTPNHILVNPILDYPPEHFECFCNKVIKTMRNRKFDIGDQALNMTRLIVSGILIWASHYMVIGTISGISSNVITILRRSTIVAGSLMTSG